MDKIREERKLKIEKLHAYYWELAEYIIKKYSPTKLDILEQLSVDRRNCLGIMCPYPLSNKQILKCISEYGAHEEECGWHIFERVAALVLTEFNKDMNFFTLFSRDFEFWRFNLTYYKRIQKTIFEDHTLPKFDWEAWGAAIDKRANNFLLGIVDEEDNNENDRQMQLLRAYGDKIMQIAKNALELE